MTVDDKADIRDVIDLTDATWQTAGQLSWTQVEHQGEPYWVVRGPDEHGKQVDLYFNQAEWDAFTGGAQDGEFD